MNQENEGLGTQHPTLKKLMTSLRSCVIRDDKCRRDFLI